jgi:AraC-like DNA-binding protein
VQLISGQPQDFLELAIQYGYYDQNHFIKEFKYFTHSTPAWHKENIDLNLYGDAWEWN